jgi:serralysin
MATKTLTSTNTNFRGNSELDTVQGSQIADSIFGGIGNDVLFGNSGNDTIDGGNDNDAISGGADEDSLLGGNGNDSILGEDGYDTIDGGAGNDTINGGAGADSMVGGDGDDTYYVDNIDDVIIESSSSKGGNDTVIIRNPLLSRDNFSQFVGIENFVQEGETDAQLSGDNNANTLKGNAGNNYIFGNGGNDSLLGYGGNDTLEGGQGIDVLDGGDGDDTYIINNVEDTIKDSSGVDAVESSETITIVSYKTVENLTLTGSKTINGTGNDNDNTIEGNDSDNKLDGGRGNDTLIGGDGNDTLVGGNGNNVLDGGNGEDDVASYNGVQSNFQVKQTDGVWSVIDIQNNTTDQLKDVEFVKFNDAQVQLATIGGFDSIPTISVKDVTLAEGNKNGSTRATVVITLDKPSTEDVTVEISTEDGTAVDGDDYNALNAETITFAAGETSKTVPINITSDLVWENDENFIVILDNAQGAEVDQGQATVTITNDDKPSLSIASAVSITEGEAGKANAEVIVTLSAPVTQDVTVSYKTTDGTAKSTGSAADFTNTKGTLTFKAGEMTKKILVPIADDKLAESSEDFRVTLSSAKGALLDTAHSVSKVTILDNDAPVTKPVLSVVAPSDVTDSSNMDAEFIVNLSAPSSKSVTVNYTTADGTAKNGSDYDVTSGTLTFAPGETTQSVFVPILGDSDIEGNETFSLKLSGAKEATLGKLSAAKATITDGDGSGSSSSAMEIGLVGVYLDVTTV